MEGYEVNNFVFQHVADSENIRRIDLAKGALVLYASGMSDAIALEVERFRWWKRL